MNSTELTEDETATLNHDFVFWIGAAVMIIGCILEFLMVVFFFVKVFCSSKSNDLKSAYFLLSVIGYIVDIISSGSALTTQLCDPSNKTIYSVISKFTVIYSEFHLGLLSVLMGLNRCTALAFPFINKKVTIRLTINLIVCLKVIHTVLTKNGF